MFQGLLHEHGYVLCVKVFYKEHKASTKLQLTQFKVKALNSFCVNPESSTSFRIVLHQNSFNLPLPQVYCWFQSSASFVKEALILNTCSFHFCHII